jgi:hypothetical protein
MRLFAAATAASPATQWMVALLAAPAGDYCIRIALVTSSGILSQASAFRVTPIPSPRTHSNIAMPEWSPSGHAANNQRDSLAQLGTIRRFLSPLCRTFESQPTADLQGRTVSKAHTGHGSLCKSALFAP